MNYNIDQNGYYGDFGGAYIPEMLYPNIFELKQKYWISVLVEKGTWLSKISIFIKYHMHPVYSDNHQILKKL